MLPAHRAPDDLQLDMLDTRPDQASSGCLRASYMLPVRRAPGDLQLDMPDTRPDESSPGYLRASCMLPVRRAPGDLQLDTRPDQASSGCLHASCAHGTRRPSAGHAGHTTRPSILWVSACFLCAGHQATFSWTCRTHDQTSRHCKAQLAHHTLGTVSEVSCLHLHSPTQSVRSNPGVKI